MINLNQYITESLFDIDNNIDVMDDDPSIMLNKKCKNLEEVIKCIADYFELDNPRIRKFTRTLRAPKWNTAIHGINLYKANGAVLNIPSFYPGKIRTMTIVEWHDSIALQYISNHEVKALICSYNNDKYEYGTSLWDWIKKNIDKKSIPPYVFKKYKH